MEMAHPKGARPGVSDSWWGTQRPSLDPGDLSWIPWGAPRSVSILGPGFPGHSPAGDGVWRWEELCTWFPGHSPAGDGVWRWEELCTWAPGLQQVLRDRRRGLTSAPALHQAQERRHLDGMQEAPWPVATRGEGEGGQGLGAWPPSA